MTPNDPPQPFGLPIVNSFHGLLIGMAGAPIVDADPAIAASANCAMTFVVTLALNGIYNWISSD